MTVDPPQQFGPPGLIKRLKWKSCLLLSLMETEEKNKVCEKFKYQSGQLTTHTPVQTMSEFYFDFCRFPKASLAQL